VGATLDVDVDRLVKPGVFFSLVVSVNLPVVGGLKHLPLARVRFGGGFRESEVEVAVGQ
jgi:hypothetical protein